MYNSDTEFSECIYDEVLILCAAVWTPLVLTVYPGEGGGVSTTFYEIIVSRL